MSKKKFTPTTNAADFVPSKARPAPESIRGWNAWIRQNLFAGPISWIATPVLLISILYMAFGMINWSMVTATKHGGSNTTCFMAERFHLLSEEKILGDVKAAVLAGGVYKKLKPATGLALAGPATDALITEAGKDKEALGALMQPLIADMTFDQLMTADVLADPQIAKVIRSRFTIFKTLEKNRSDIVRRSDPEETIHPDLEPILAGLDLPAQEIALQAALKAKDGAAIKAGLHDVEPAVRWAEAHNGACWTVVKRRWPQFMYGFYPKEHVWRVGVTGLLLLLGIVSLMLPSRTFNRRNDGIALFAIGLGTLAFAAAGSAMGAIVVGAILLASLWPRDGKFHHLVPHGLIGLLIGYCFTAGLDLTGASAFWAYAISTAAALGYGLLSTQWRAILYVIGFPIAAIWLLIRFSLPQAVQISEGIPSFLVSVVSFPFLLVYGLVRGFGLKIPEGDWIWPVVPFTTHLWLLGIAAAILALIWYVDYSKGNEAIKPRFVAWVMGGVFLANYLPSIAFTLFGFSDFDATWMPAISSFRFFVGAILVLITGSMLISRIRLQLATGGIQPMGLLFNLAILLLTIYVFFTTRVVPEDPNAIQGFLGSLTLPDVEVDSIWGGLLATAVTGLTGIAISLPLGIVLALGRRSDLPIVSTVCTGFIELIRGVPLITILFMASVLLPLFLPEGVTVNKLLRALVGVSLFASAYMAEVIRGGLQGLNKGQKEGADSLGLSFWQTQRFIILPQAIKISIPGIVNTFIGLYKDTTLLSIVGIFDLLGVGTRSVLPDLNWARLEAEVYVFIAIFFFLSCFFMSRYSMYLERRLATDHR